MANLSGDNDVKWITQTVLYTWDTCGSNKPRQASDLILSGAHATHHTSGKRATPTAAEQIRQRAPNCLRAVVGDGWLSAIRQARWGIEAKKKKKKTNKKKERKMDKSGVTLWTPERSNKSSGCISCFPNMDTWPLRNDNTGLTLRLVIASVFIGRADARLPSITVLEGGPPHLPLCPLPTPKLPPPPRGSAADCGCGGSSM